jgi:formylglycine-generating enzyme required for sulfatase activity
MYLSGRVASDSRDTQTPRYGKIKNARLNLGDVVFALPRRESQPPTPSPGLDPAAIELAMWQSAEKGGAIADYEEYLRHYKQGRFAGMARNRIIALRGTAANPAPVRPEATTTMRMSVAGVPLIAMSFTTAQVNIQLQIVNRRQEQCWGYVEDLGNGVKLEMVEIPAGEFLMGEDAAGVADFEKECAQYWDNKNDCTAWVRTGTPQRRVKVNGFLIGKYEVTQKQWVAVMGALPPNMSLSVEGSQFKGDDLPVVRISWDEAQEFTRRLNEKLKLSRSIYRLPSEAEWEYVARAGTRTPYAFGSTISSAVVNYNFKRMLRTIFTGGVYRDRPVAVGSLGLANAWGLYDMHGNVTEWCEDDWHDSYNGAPSDDRAWVDIPNRATERVFRGGSWFDGSFGLRSAYRKGAIPGIHTYALGFRLVRAASGK